MTQIEKKKLSFEGLGINPDLLSVIEKYFTEPTPIQYQVIPASFEGKDIVGIAQTGTGKTLAFGIPMLQKLNKGDGQGLILVPTRELAQQVADAINKINRDYSKMTITVLIGGASSYDQIRDLRRNPKIIVATPGRLMDHLNRGNLTLSKVEIVVLDEADRMFDIGFMPQIKSILKECPKERETLLFSATMPDEIAKIATSHMKMPINIEVAPAGTTVDKIEQEVFIIDREKKIRLLEKILLDNPEPSDTVLIFVRTKHSARKMTILVRDMGYTAAELHSNRSLFQRKEALQGFKSGKYRILICTDIASRGIDVNDISIVLNYDLPDNTEDYVHRIGRTGRAGKTGRAITFATHREKSDLRYIERLIRKQLSILALPELPEARPERTDLFVEDTPRGGRNSNRRDGERGRERDRGGNSRDRGSRGRSGGGDRGRSSFAPRQFVKTEESKKRDFSLDHILDNELSDFSSSEKRENIEVKEKKFFVSDRKNDSSSERSEGRGSRFNKPAGERSSFGSGERSERPSFERREGGSSFRKSGPSRFSSRPGGSSSGSRGRSFGGERSSSFGSGERSERPSFERREGGSSFRKSGPSRFSSRPGGSSSGGPRRSFGERGSFFRGGESGEKPSFEKREGGSSFKKSGPSRFSSRPGGSSSGGPRRSFGERGSFFKGGESTGKPTFEKREGGSNFRKSGSGSFSPRPRSSNSGGPRRSFGGSNRKSQ